MNKEKLRIFLENNLEKNFVLDDGDVEWLPKFVDKFESLGGNMDLLETCCDNNFSSFEDDEDYDDPDDQDLEYYEKRLVEYEKIIEEYFDIQEENED